MHRLLQRGFAKLYGYNLPSGQSLDAVIHDERAVAETDYVQAALESQSTPELHYNMKGARFFVSVQLCVFAVSRPPTKH